MTGDPVGLADQSRLRRFSPSSDFGRASSWARSRSADSRSGRSSARGWPRSCCRRAPPRRTRPRFGLLGALLGGAILASGLEGLGFRLRRTLIIPGMGHDRRRLRRALGAALALGIVWIAPPSPGRRRARASCRPTSSARRSCASSTRCCLRQAPILNALARLDPLPSISGPSPDVAAPNRRSPAHRPSGAPRTASCAWTAPRAAWRSRARAGWHSRTWSSPTRTSSPASRTPRSRSPASRRACRPSRSPSTRSNDIAVLLVPGLNLPPLRLAPSPPPAPPGRSSATPRTVPSTCSRRASGARRAWSPRTPTARARSRALLTPLRGLVRPGNSGGPLVDLDGRVLTTVFAATVGGGPRAATAWPTKRSTGAPAERAQSAHGPVSTGPCAG